MVKLKSFAFRRFCQKYVRRTRTYFDSPALTSLFIFIHTIPWLSLQQSCSSRMITLQLQRTGMSLYWNFQFVHRSLSFFPALECSLSFIPCSGSAARGARSSRVSLISPWILRPDDGRARARGRGLGPEKHDFQPSDRTNEREKMRIRPKAPKMRTNERNFSCGGEREREAKRPQN